MIPALNLNQKGSRENATFRTTAASSPQLNKKDSTTMPTAAQLAANRANAQLSTGPRSPEGKQTAAANSTRHGLSGAFTLLPHENAADYSKLHDAYTAEFSPASVHEEFLVKQMAQARWRLGRARRLETLLRADYASPAPANPDSAIRTAMKFSGTNAPATTENTAA